MIPTGPHTTVPAGPQADVGAEMADRTSRSYGKLAKEGIIWSFFREGISEFISTPTAIILARLLSPLDFGIAAAAGFFLTLATRLANFGFNQALVRIKKLRPEHCSSVFVVSLATGVAVYLALLSTAGLMAAFFREPQIRHVMPIAALTFLVAPFGTVPAALMSRNMMFRRTAVADWASSLAESASTIYLAWTGSGYWSIVYGRVVGAVVNAVVKISLGRWRPSLRFSSTAMGELFSFGSGIFVKRLLDFSANQLDNIVVGRMLGLSPLGLYDKAFVTVNKVLIRINTGGPMVTFRIFALIYDDAERFRRAYSRVILAASLVSYPVLLALAAAAPDLLHVMYGKRWLPAAVPFQILCVAGILKVLNEYAGTAAQAWGKIWGQVSRQAIATALIVVFVAAFSRWGLAGAAFGVLLATVSMTVLMNLLLMRLSGIPASSLLRAQLPGMLCGAIVSGSVLAVRLMAGSFGASAPWMRLLPEVAAGAVAYLGFIKLNRFRDVRILVRDAAVDLGPPLGRLVRLLG